jgi:DUF2924 family protein
VTPMDPKRPLLVRAPRDPLNLEWLSGMQQQELRRLYCENFARDVPAGNYEHARRRIAWHLQAQKEGGLPASARQHALAIASAASLRIRMTAKKVGTDPLQHATVTRLVSDHDPRVPMPGSVLVKEYRGRTIAVRVFDSGFEYDGRRFSSLSAIAKEITGTKWNGLLFFGLAKGKARGR